MKQTRSRQRGRVTPKKQQAPGRRCLWCQRRFPEHHRIGWPPTDLCPHCIERAEVTMRVAHDHHGTPVVWNAERTMGTTSYPVWWWAKGYRWPDRDGFLTVLESLADS